MLRRFSRIVFQGWVSPGEHKWLSLGEHPSYAQLLASNMVEMATDLQLSVELEDALSYLQSGSAEST